MPELDLATLIAMPLPVVEIVDTSGMAYYPIRANAGSTRSQDPIRTLRHSPPSDLGPIPRSLYCEPDIDPYAIIQTEADLARLAGTHLIYAINHALDALLPCHLAGTIKCLSEHTVNSCRFDVVWTTMAGKCLALEYKRPFSAFPDEWSMILAESEEIASVIVQQSYELETPNEGSNNATLLGRNATILSKQARKYAQSTGVDCVVLFDGRNMIGLTFAVSNEEVGGWHEVRAPIAYWAVSEEFENESINSPLEIGRTFREALLSTLYSSVMRQLGSV